MVLRSFGDRVEVFVVSVPLSPSFGRIQPLSDIKLVIRCSQQVILVLLIYRHEDQATLVLIHIGSLSETVFYRDVLRLHQIPPDPEEPLAVVGCGRLGGIGVWNPRVPWRRRVNRPQLAEELLDNFLTSDIL